MSAADEVDPNYTTEIPVWLAVLFIHSSALEAARRHRDWLRRCRLGAWHAAWAARGAKPAACAPPLLLLLLLAAGPVVFLLALLTAALAMFVAAAVFFGHHRGDVPVERRATHHLCRPPALALPCRCSLARRSRSPARLDPRA